MLRFKIPGRDIVSWFCLKIIESRLDFQINMDIKTSQRYVFKQKLNLIINSEYTNDHTQCVYYEIWHLAKTEVSVALLTWFIGSSLTWLNTTFNYTFYNKNICLQPFYLQGIYLQPGPITRLAHLADLYINGVVLS